MTALVKTKFIVVCVEVKNVQSAHDSGAFRSSSSESFFIQLRSEHVQVCVYEASLSAHDTAANASAGVNVLDVLLGCRRDDSGLLHTCD